MLGGIPAEGRQKQRCGGGKERSCGRSVALWAGPWELKGTRPGRKARQPALNCHSPHSVPSNASQVTSKTQTEYKESPVSIREVSLRNLGPLSALRVLTCSLMLQGKGAGGRGTRCFPNLVGQRTLSSRNYYSLEVTLGNVVFGNGEPPMVVEQLIEKMGGMEASKST